MGFKTFAAAVAALTAIAASPALAQSPFTPALTPDSVPQNRVGISIYGPGQLNENASSATLFRDRGRYASEPAEMNARERARTAQAALTKAGVACTVSEAIFLGNSGLAGPIFEAACGSEPGYVVLDADEVIALPCTQLASGQGQRQAEVIDECRLPANAMTFPRIKALAQQAGVDCNIDEASQVGRSPDGAVYEIGCRGADGYWVRRHEDAWTSVPCLKITGQGGACGYSTDAERFGTLKARLAATPAQACDVHRTRYVGSAGGEDFFEVGCVGATGFILKTGADASVKQTWSCSGTLPIAGGCTFGRP